MRQFFQLNIRDSLITAGVILMAAVVCGLLRIFSDSDIYVPLIFVLAVLIVSRFTNGYFYGILTSVVAVFGVNYIFTYPYFAFNFTITGYPLTFISMFVVSVITSALTTQVKRQEQMRAETEKETLRANLLRAISHDLRTPLTSIAGSSSAILEDEGNLTDAQKRALLEEVKDNAEWLIRMVENLLSVTRMGGDATIRKSPEALEEVVGEAAQKFRRRFPDVPLAVSIPQELVFLDMDALLIEQVLMNLLENAAQHGMPRAPVALSAALDGETAVFAVDNAGPPIDPRRMQRCFDGGYADAGERGEEGSRRNMGIGLSVCASIVRAHKGDILAENRPDGVRFRFTLPMGGIADGKERGRG